MFGLIFFICVSSSSPTLPYDVWKFWTLNTHNSEVVAFVDETCQRYCVEADQVKEILVEDYFYRVKSYAPKTKSNRMKALRHMLGWCRYWRDSYERLRLDHNSLAYHSKAECFFRTLERNG